MTNRAVAVLKGEGVQGVVWFTQVIFFIHLIKYK